jgi:hypothetical protein
MTQPNVMPLVLYQDVRLEQSNGAKLLGQCSRATRSRANHCGATIMLQNGLHGDVDYSVLCTTHKAETWFGFNSLQFMGLYSKSPKLAFNQWVAGSSPARLINKTNRNNNCERPYLAALLIFATILLGFAAPLAATPHLDARPAATPA